MLPSFRLIVATFVFGFVMVYAGLRLAVSLNGALPVTTAHAGGHVLPTADGEARLASMPAMFDTRFAIAPAPVVLARTTPSVLERPSLPLAVVPPQDATAADPAAPADVATERAASPDSAPPTDPQP